MEQNNYIPPSGKIVYTNDIAQLHTEEKLLRL
jgi:hypothetical protein